MKSALNRKKAVDTEFLRGIVENDKEFERELFEIFRENANRNIIKMDESIKDSDNNSWYMASHAFKGAAASIGAFDLSMVLEFAQKHPEDSPEKKVEILAKIKEELKYVSEFIDEELLNDK